MRTNVAVCIFALGLLAMLGAAFVTADPNAPTTLDVIGSSSRDISALPAQSAEAQGGNVTEINIEALTITRSWQGYYGDISGQIALQDGNNNTFYNWSIVSPSGEVYATRSSSITWGSVNCTNASARNAEETYLNMTPSFSDSVMNTFNSTTHPSIAVGGTVIPQNTCFSTNGYVNNESQSTDFVMLLLQSGVNIIYTTIIDDNTVGFDGEQHDFQLLVGENERNSTGVTSYYFWVELS